MTSSAASDAKLTRTWPDWDGRDYESIARYIDPSELEDAAIAPWIRFNDAEADDPVGLLAQVFTYVQSLQIRYGLEPWISGSGQRIRWPALIRRDCGTCLDVAVLYASVLLRCQFRPMLVFAESRGAAEGHVVVMVDLRSPLQDIDLRANGDRLPLEQLDLNTPHLYSLPTGRPPAGFVIFDPTTATVADDFWTFEDAIDVARDLVSDDDRYARKVVLDVAGAKRGHESSVYAIPNVATGASAVWTRLPPRASPPPLFDNDQLMSALKGAAGRVAIVGESGTGKSVLAHRGAAGWDNGYGWFVNAADRRTLQSELAQIELLQRSRSLAVNQSSDDEVALSRAALRRLAESRMPWVVVLDNADNDPGSIIDLVPAPRWSGQRVIVTSTHPAWVNWADNSIQLGRIARGGSRLDRSELSDRSWRALEVDIADRLGGPVAEGSFDGLPALVAIGRERLSPGAQEIALTIAWAPATELKVDTLVESNALAKVHGELVELERLGLVGIAQSRERTVAMHRAVAEEVRRWDPDTVRSSTRRLRRLMGNVPLVRRFAEAAEERVMVRLIRLAERCLDARSIAGPLFVLSDVLEGRGMSKEAADFAARCLERSTDDLSASDVAQAKLRVVRHTKNHARDAASLEASLVSVKELLDGLASAPQGEEALFYYQCLATEGLVRRQLAKRALSGEQLAEELQAARALILEAATRRAEIIGPEAWLSSLERQNGLFGIAAVSLDLAKSHHSDPVQAAALLGDALQMYTLVRDAVDEFYGRDTAHPRGAAAEYGRALCFYYSALFEVRPLMRSESQIFGLSSVYEAGSHEVEIESLPRPVDDRSAPSLLVAAHDALMESLRGRIALQVGSDDGPDVVKCLRLGIEISAARIVWASGATKGIPPGQMSARAVEDLLYETEQNFRNEWQQFAGVAETVNTRTLGAVSDARGYVREWTRELPATAEKPTS